MRRRDTRGPLRSQADCDSPAVERHRRYAPCAAIGAIHNLRLTDASLQWTFSTDLGVRWAHDTLRRLTFDHATSRKPVWTPDGKRIVFASNRAKGHITFTDSVPTAGRNPTVDRQHERAGPGIVASNRQVPGVSGTVASNRQGPDDFASGRRRNFGMETRQTVGFPRESGRP